MAVPAFVRHTHVVVALVTAAIIGEAHRTIGVAAVGDFDGHRAGDLPVRGAQAAIERATQLDRSLRMRRFDGRDVKSFQALEPVDVRAYQSFDIAVLRAGPG